MNTRPLLVLAALAAASEPDFGKDAVQRVKDGIRKGYAKDPLGTTVNTVLVASWLFYRAEKGHNPKVQSFYDALVYVSTNLSVGFCDILAKTPAGKTIGTALMTLGPAMATRALDEASADGEGASTRAIVDRLDKILGVLEKRPPAP
jgi:voltage-gated potassium channel